MRCAKTQGGVCKKNLNQKLNRIVSFSFQPKPTTVGFGWKEKVKKNIFLKKKCFFFTVRLIRFFLILQIKKKRINQLFNQKVLRTFWLKSRFSLAFCKTSQTCERRMDDLPSKVSRHRDCWGQKLTRFSFSCRRSTAKEKENESLASWKLAYRFIPWTSTSTSYEWRPGN